MTDVAAAWHSLRDYQQKGVRDIADAFKQHRSVLWIAPTGSGKTPTFAFIAARQRERGKRSLILVHRRELLRQTLAKCADFRAVAGAIARDHPFEPEATVQVASSQLLARRIKDTKLDLAGWEPTLIILDEAHHGCSPSLRAIVDHWPEAKVLGVTATPERLDGKGLDDVFDVLVNGPDPGTLIKQGWLSSYRAYSHPLEGFDRSALHVRAGDFKTDEMEGQLDVPVCLGNVVEHYARHLAGKPALAFAVSIAHAQHLADAFRTAGHPAASVDGTMSMDERDGILAGYERGEIKVLCSCEILGEGLDVPDTAGVILVRPTKSLTLALQQIGRALRPKADGEPAIILDHVGNLREHGLPDEPRAWSLAGKKSRRAPKVPIACRFCSVLSPAATRFCPNCSGFLGTWQPCKSCHAVDMHDYLGECPACGKDPAGRPAPSAAGAKPRGDLAVIAGELQEIRRGDTQWMTAGDIRFAIRRAKSLAELVEIAIKRAAAGQLELKYGPLSWARFHWKRKLLEIEKDPRRRAVLEARSYAETVERIDARDLAEWYAHQMGYKRSWVYRQMQKIDAQPERAFDL